MVTVSMSQVSRDPGGPAYGRVEPQGEESGTQRGSRGSLEEQEAAYTRRHQGGACVTIGWNFDFICV